MRSGGIAAICVLLGGELIKQHFIILILLVYSCRLLASQRLCDEIERTMFVWLITITPGKEYERRIVDAAHALRSTTNLRLSISRSHPFQQKQRFGPRVQVEYSPLDFKFW